MILIIALICVNVHAKSKPSLIPMISLSGHPLIEKMIGNVISINKSSRLQQKYILTITKNKTTPDTIRLRFQKYPFSINNSDIMMYCNYNLVRQNPINGWTIFNGVPILISCNGVQLKTDANFINEKRLFLSLNDIISTDGDIQIWFADIISNSLVWKSYYDGFSNKKYIDKETYDLNKDRINAIFKKEREEQKKNNSEYGDLRPFTIDTFYIIIPEGW